jgi:hypothetical protein
MSQYALPTGGEEDSPAGSDQPMFFMWDQLDPGSLPVPEVVEVPESEPEEVAPMYFMWEHDPGSLHVEGMPEHVPKSDAGEQRRNFPSNWLLGM